MEIIIIGAGAMGCLYGAYLSKSHQVTMIDTNPSVIEQINQNGIAIVEEEGKEYFYKENIKAYLSGEYNGKAQLIIMFVKSTYLTNALEQNKHLFNQRTVVLSLQNGAGNDRKIEKYAKKENIIIGTSKHNGITLAPGRSKHIGSGYTTIGSNHQASKILDQICVAFNNVGFNTIISDDIQRIIWNKLFVNLSINTFTAITKTPIGFMAKNEYAWNFAKRLIYEAIDVAEEDGTYFDRREVLEEVRKICFDVENGYSSMYQDTMRKQKTEIDAINGAIVEQAKIYGVPVPYNTLVVDILHAIEGAYQY